MPMITATVRRPACVCFLPCLLAPVAALVPGHAAAQGEGVWAPLPTVGVPSPRYLHSSAPHSLAPGAYKATEASAVPAGQHSLDDRWRTFDNALHAGSDTVAVHHDCIGNTRRATGAQGRQHRSAVGVCGSYLGSTL
jgi:hypothetical protein